MLAFSGGISELENEVLQGRGKTFPVKLGEGWCGWGRAGKLYCLPSFLPWPCSVANVS